MEAERSGRRDELELPLRRPLVREGRARHSCARAASREESHQKRSEANHFQLHRYLKHAVVLADSVGFMRRSAIKLVAREVDDEPRRFVALPRTFECRSRRPN